MYPLGSPFAALARELFRVPIATGSERAAEHCDLFRACGGDLPWSSSIASDASSPASLLAAMGQIATLIVDFLDI